MLALRPSEQAVREALADRLPGQPLDQLTHREYRAESKSDLSGVRIHRDSAAAALAADLGAEAFTRGDDIYFAAGSYAADTTEGRRLLHHELAHVLQQRRQEVSAYAGRLVPGDHVSEREAAADMSLRASSSTHVAPNRACVQRQAVPTEAQDKQWRDDYETGRQAAARKEAPSSDLLFSDGYRSGYAVGVQAALDDERNLQAVLDSGVIPLPQGDAIPEKLTYTYNDPKVEAQEEARRQARHWEAIRHPKFAEHTAKIELSDVAAVAKGGVNALAEMGEEGLGYFLGPVYSAVPEEYKPHYQPFRIDKEHQFQALMGSVWVGALLGGMAEGLAAPGGGSKEPHLPNMRGEREWPSAKGEMPPDVRRALEDRTGVPVEGTAQTQPMDRFVEIGPPMNPDDVQPEEIFQAFGRGDKSNFKWLARVPEEDWDWGQRGGQLAQEWYGEGPVYKYDVTLEENEPAAMGKISDQPGALPRYAGDPPKFQYYNPRGFRVRIINKVRVWPP